MVLKKFRIVKIHDYPYGLNYRVDQRHWFLFIPWWDIGAYDLCPKYLFDTKEEAEKAILKLICIYKNGKC